MKLRYSPLIKQSVRLGEHINPHKKLSWKQANKLKNVVNRSKKQSDFSADLLEYRRLTSVYGGLTKSSFTKIQNNLDKLYENGKPDWNEVIDHMGFIPQHTSENIKDPI